MTSAGLNFQQQDHFRKQTLGNQIMMMLHLAPDSDGAKTL
jgi:hypothetical protein